VVTQVWLLALAKQGFPIECHNRPGPPFCRYFVPDEWAVSGNVVMRKADDGRFVLDARAKRKHRRRTKASRTPSVNSQRSGR
jgi:hypothetical protein